VLSFELVQLPPNVSMQLATVEAYERLILADGEAVGLDTTYHPRSTGEVIGPEMDH
jgi:hypothetical protein